MDNLTYWVSFCDKLHPYRQSYYRRLSINIGNIFRLLNEFKSLKKLFEAPEDEIYNTNDKMITNFLRTWRNANLDAYNSEVKRLLDNGINIISYEDKAYPKKLKMIRDPPLVLFHRGSLMDFDNCVAIIGTRNPSDFGRQSAREISRDIAQKGYTIASGLAKGIDTGAHYGALDAGGKTIAVLGTNIETIYPKENMNLSVDITKSGALLSEMSPSQQTKKFSFVQRNRIISGISKCLLVIESGSTPGTFWQVKLALDQRCKVFVLKYRGYDEPSVRRFRELIKLGGVPFSSSEEVINHLESNSHWVRADTLTQSYITN
ncbi:MAG: DNA processing protein DprA [candidate division WS2 bacterium]|uniref:DNA processing protein DprA n=1 Tax=Psychracetigena formicireducens TaxID=2986056 RepID=A0A9E2F5E5_PSYF1|nr:DNA processing protein DprA [Candidatus Psychracetigena formicireducens]